MSVELGLIFCKRCDDFVYVRRLESLRSNAENSCRESLNLSAQCSWYPDAVLTEAFHDKSVRMACLSERIFGLLFYRIFLHSKKDFVMIVFFFKTKNFDESKTSKLH